MFQDLQKLWQRRREKLRQRQRQRQRQRPIQLFRPEHHVLRRRPHRQRILALTLVLGLGVVEPGLNPPAAEACFFWQACARRRGRASNTRAGGKRTGHIVGGNDAAVPYVISPRNAWIQQPAREHPYTIRWNPVEGADSYTVRIWHWTLERDRPEIALWETTTVDNTPYLAFPQLVFLEPGSYYSIEVVTDTGVSSDLDEGYYDSGFQLLFEEDYAELRSQLCNVIPEDYEELRSERCNASSAIPASATLTAEELTDDVALASAGVFFLEEMYTDALAILLSLADSPTASDLVYTALGDTYSQSGLNQLAIEAYQQALTLITDDLSDSSALSEATTRVNLADVYATLGLFEQALQQLRQARDVYKQLGEETEMARLDRRIDVISNRLLRQRDEESAP